MIEFFTVSGATRIMITFILGICVLAQTFVIMLNFYRHDKTIRSIFENLFEVSILGEIFILSLLH